MRNRSERGGEHWGCRCGLHRRLLQIPDSYCQRLREIRRRGTHLLLLAGLDLGQIRLRWVGPRRSVESVVLLAIRREEWGLRD
ncbi:hypothetical protein Vadar_014991 [Vaccinium darrowii]|uniref:Uncharacterized protein n=1 Tax=Vaccinium darrowii TaxID=229202 RepID=A0ACB7ZCR8_9ERIC|nr:hypothetical protein Vadar_014991 [Vaccinium darrowii]